MSRGLFITGTDTGIGKTRVTAALLTEFSGAGLRVAGYKPVAAGAEFIDGRWCNDDALLLQVLSCGSPDYELINPLCLPLPVSPHLAAGAVGVVVDLARLVQSGQALLADYDVVVAEGAGGWRVPLADGVDIATLAGALAWPVILVVGLRLGCINHACLTAEAMRADGVIVAGWVANAIDPDLPLAAEVRNTLLQRLDIPLLADMMPGAVDLQWTAAGSQWRKEILQIVFDSPK